MSGLQGLGQENIWFDKSRYDEAERHFYEGRNGIPQTPQVLPPTDPGVRAKHNLRCEINRAVAFPVVDNLRAVLSKLESRMAVLEKSQAPASKTVTVTKAAPVQKPKVEEHNGADDDDDIDLFGSDEEDEDAERIKAERVKEYTQRKSKKPALIAKSSILLDVKPWDDETKMSKLEECVRSIQMDGLLWGASKLVPVGYGIKKLQINCVVEDDKVGTDILEEEITKFEDYVQSVDIAAFNKI
uniref:Elongation factor 1-delta-like n=1 Tax=Sinocyclocheilus grahami TaxID=75366 RepID=A0A672JS88_SINGR